MFYICCSHNSEIFKAEILYSPSSELLFAYTVLHARRLYFSRNESVCFSEEDLIWNEQYELKRVHSIEG
jgi:hypothetical protein